MLSTVTRSSCWNVLIVATHEKLEADDRVVLQTKTKRIEGKKCNNGVGFVLCLEIRIKGKTLDYFNLLTYRSDIYVCAQSNIAIIGATI